MRPLLLLALLAAASPFSLAASVTLRGRATGAGALAGCKVRVVNPPTRRELGGGARWLERGRAGEKVGAHARACSKKRATGCRQTATR